MDFPEDTQLEDSTEECTHSSVEEKKGKRICLECFQILDAEISYTEKDSATFGPKELVPEGSQREEKKRETFSRTSKAFNSPKM